MSVCALHHTSRSPPPRKTRNLLPIPADRHRTPSPPVRPRLVAEEKPATRIGAPAHTRLRAFDKNFRRGPCNGRQQPVQTPFASDKFQFPVSTLVNHLVVPFRYA